MPRARLYRPPIFTFEDRGTGLDGLKYQTFRAFGLKSPVPPAVLDEMIDAAADRHGIKRNVFHALVRVESGRNPEAVSPKGAVGLAQVMPANLFRCECPHRNCLKDPWWNLLCGSRILGQDTERLGGDLFKGLTVYNCGKVNCPAGQRYAAKVLKLAGKG